MNDDDVQFHWSIAGFDTDEENEECLHSIINKLVAIRGFSSKKLRKDKIFENKLYCDH